MASETQIRDKLSTSLDVLEPGLTLIEVNHKLPNDRGAKGFIDILAKDRSGNIVIIELKRSDATAREALFEILKYMPLFRREHGIQAHRMRCFIVSTAWHELLTPFSEFRRLCETQTEGIYISTDDAGNVISAKRVQDNPTVDSAQPFKTHCIYLYPSATEREAAAKLITAALHEAGARGYLLFRIDYHGGTQRVIYPFAVYITITQIEKSISSSLSRQAARDLGDEDGPPSPLDVRLYIEDNFLALVNDKLWCHIDTADLEINMGSSDVFMGMVEGDWSILTIDRHGPFRSSAITSDEELILLVKGISGDNDILFERLLSPKNRLDWAHARSAAGKCLLGNPAWAMGHEWFLEQVENEFPDSLVFVRIYNPLHLPETLYQLARGAHDYTPRLTAIVLPQMEKSPSPVVLFGTLVWGKQTIPKSVNEIFSDLCGTVAGYYLARGTAWALDDELVRRHGLEYKLWWITPELEAAGLAKTVLVSQGNIRAEVSEGPDLTSLTNYSDIARQYLRDLCRAIDACTHRSASPRG